MKLVFSEQAWDDCLHWQRHDAKLVQRIYSLIKECTRTPFSGIGKPEPLRGALSGWWSRRINHEHRLVYKVDGDALKIAVAGYWYQTQKSCPCVVSFRRMTPRSCHVCGLLA